MFMFLNQINKSFEAVERFKYLGRAITDQNYIHRAKRRLNSRDSFC
jgi:hypothetical protein